MNEEKAIKRATSLFEYIREIVKIGSKPIRDVLDYRDEFLMFPQDFPSHNNIIFFDSEDKSFPWITIKKIDKQPPPNPPEIIRDLVGFSENPDIQPTLRVTNNFETNVETLADYSNQEHFFNQYIEKWTLWAEETKKRDDIQKIFTRFFHLHTRLKNDEEFELVWGQGLLLWKLQDVAIRYPVVTQKMSVEYSPVEGIIKVLPEEDSEPSVDISSLDGLQFTVDFKKLKTSFEEVEFNPAQPDSYLDYLKEVAGSLSPVSAVEPMDPSTSNYFPSDKLKIVDTWVLFLRKRRQDIVIQDADNFVSLFNKGAVGSNSWQVIKNIVEDASAESSIENGLPNYDEWSIVTDDEVLFPLPSNQEQVLILDRYNRNTVIVVQGPPGTGKSHTIANLICHFMAQGKKVIVTTKKDQPLSVLSRLIPDELKPLCMNLVGTTKESRDKLETAVNFICEGVTQHSEFEYQGELEQLNQKFDNIRRDLSSVQNEIKLLSREQFTKIVFNNQKYLPSDLALMLKGEEKNHAWFKDRPPYVIEEDLLPDGEIEKSVTVIIPLDDKTVDELKHLRNKLINFLEDLGHDLPDPDRLLHPDEFSSLIRDLQKLESITTKLSDTLSKDDLATLESLSIEFLKDVREKLNQLIFLSKQITEPWQKKITELCKSTSPESIVLSYTFSELKNIQGQITDKYKGFFIFDPKLKNEPAIDLEDLKCSIEKITKRLKSGKNPFGIFKNNDKKTITLVSILGREARTLDEWEAALSYLEYLLLCEDFQGKWSAIANQIGAPIIQEERFDVQSFVKKAESTISKAGIPLRYTYLCENIAEMLKPYQNIFNCDLIYTEPESILGRIQILTDYSTFSKAKSIQEDQLNYLRSIIVSPKIHQIARDLVLCLTDYQSNPDRTITSWELLYQRLLFYRNLSEDYKRFIEGVEKLKKLAPHWVQMWLNKAFSDDEVCPPQWRTSWEHSALRKLLEDIQNKTKKIQSLEKSQEYYTEDLSKLKKQLVLIKAKLNLKKNISSYHLQALNGWALAVRKLGRTRIGKNAWKKAQLVREQMEKAKDAVPVWVMPLYRVSETIPSIPGYFDVVIVDEASQCDIRALLALVRGKKAIIVGDDKQISPEDVGVNQNIIESLNKQYLTDIPCRKFLDLRTSLYDLGKLRSGNQNVLMLKEHFRCVPEIIEFCNQLCYKNQGGLVPLRSPSLSERLYPALEAIYIPEGYRLGKNINKPEAEKICERIAIMVKDPIYQGKSIGVIILTGSEEQGQVNYIQNLIDNYVAPEKLDAINFRVGNPYAFQGDERDIILMSMVVGGNDEKKFVPLTSERFIQRFNVAVSRARDKIILFHSVQLGIDLNNAEDMRYNLLHYFTYGYLPFSIKIEPAFLEDNFDSPFEQRVYEWLTSRDYSVISQFKVGHKRIDLVVEDGKNRLAIECDGASYHTPETWWDDIVRQRQLERLGWKFCRIWGTAFYSDPESAMMPVIEKLKTLKIFPKRTNGK